ncbi:MAG: chorismate-binding protein, partial [Polyangiaceae bacterium]
MDTTISVDLDELSAFCAKSLTDVAGRDTMGIISMPVPIAPLETFLSAASKTMSLMWHSPAGHAIAASGAAARIDVHGASRLTQLREQADALFASMTPYAFPGWEGPRARIFGGLAFAVGEKTDAPWEEFGDGCFTLPRWTYSKSQEGASLTLATRGTDDTGLTWRDGVMNELEGIFEALQFSRGRASIAPPGVSIPRDHVRQSSFAQWQSHIGKIHEAIESGGFEKIVAARRCEVDLVKPLSDLDVLARLIWETRCVRFYFRRERTAFLGASPETLFAKTGLQLTSEALAGTIRSFGSDIPRLEGQSSRLMNSDKDLSEHGYVVREIRNSLAPLSAEVTMHEKPEIRKIRNILHLNTRLSAALLPS